MSNITDVPVQGILEMPVVLYRIEDGAPVALDAAESRSAGPQEDPL